MLLRHIRYFLAVAEQGNFTRAAEALHVSQPTLSQQIKQLEDTLGAPLFDRSGRAVRLTDAGEAWMRYARLALQDLDAGARAIHDVATLERGHLRLAMTPTFTAYLVGPAIDAFYRRYPGITLSIEEMAQERIEALLAQDRLDLGIAFEMAQSAEVEAAALFSETLELMVGAGHPLAARHRPLTLAEWQHLPLALLSGDFATRQFIDRYCTQLGFRPQVAVEANALGAIVEIVRRGQLATLLPAAIARENRQLKKVALANAMPVRQAVWLQRKGAYRSAAAQAFIAVLQEQGVTPTPPSAASSPADAPARSRGKSAN
ncbi:transcriptional regulator CynR [Serratia marcescens]|uniref:Transcriptional regulator CynR n=3 Tax=Serratia TaxID=613 RepID=A0AAW6X1J6_9GAMM|nr:MULTISPECIES: transcriptional regulator CynR [Serratia]EGT0506253.1 transcriptional regulator CynR [Serratia marcescens]EGT3593822.1 transcriptional regulator CynR [Serratia marcescens]EHT9832323.1 transcriptional regulator CynR [Serratia marcescens]EIU0973557.1 transcriptional regulator CynR [Serratia marcescens]EMB4112786.1 transcriptional regulator CynR [Serratia marcescens]